MHEPSWLPDAELLTSDDPDLWAARFVSQAWWDPRFAADERMVSYWFYCAFLAVKSADLAEISVRHKRILRGLALNRVLLIVFIGLLVVWLVWTVLQAAGVVP